MNRNLKNAFAVGMFALFGANNHSNAQSFFPNDARIDYAVSGDAIVGYANGFVQSDSPNVSLVTGGIISGNLSAYNSSNITVSGGSAANMTAYNSTIWKISGGDIGSTMYARNNSTVNFSADEANSNLFSYDNSTSNLTAGNIRYVYSYGVSLVNFSGNAGGITTNGASTLNFDGGNIISNSNLISYDNSTVNLTGGLIGGDIYVRGNSTLNLLGKGLSDTLIDPYNVGFSQYRLSGRLSDGTDVTGKFFYVENGGGAKFTLNNVPAPSSVLVLALGAVPFVGVLRRRRK